MAGIYIHIPYCTKACHYCDFHFSTSRQDQSRMVEALCAELELRRGYLHDASVQTIYFGGGTPSVLTSDQLDILLRRIKTLFRVDGDAEITLEANPEDMQPDRLGELRSAGINRLSIGIQTFHDETLRALNRVHDGSQARRAVENALRAGFTNLSLDIMFGIPGRSVDQLKADLNDMLIFSPEHISAYGLTVEERTVLGKRAAAGTFLPITDDEQAAEFELVMDTLEGAGYRQYEVSNFCRPGFASQHNSAYWQGVAYLGIGPGAHSFNSSSRQANVAHNTRYMAAIESGQIPAEVEVLSLRDKIHDYLLTSLRTDTGCDIHHLREQLDFNLTDYRGNYIDGLQHSGHATLDRDRLILTRKGKMIADRIASDLFLADGEEPVTGSSYP